MAADPFLLRKVLTRRNAPTPPAAQTASRDSGAASAAQPDTAKVPSARATLKAVPRPSEKRAARLAKKQTPAAQPQKAATTPAPAKPQKQPAPSAQGAVKGKATPVPLTQAKSVGAKPAAMGPAECRSGASPVKGRPTAQPQAKPAKAEARPQARPAAKPQLQRDEDTKASGRNATTEASPASAPKAKARASAQPQAKKAPAEPPSKPRVEPTSPLAAKTKAEAPKAPVNAPKQAMRKTPAETPAPAAAPRVIKRPLPERVAEQAEPAAAPRAPVKRPAPAVVRSPVRDKAPTPAPAPKQERAPTDDHGSISRRSSRRLLRHDLTPMRKGPLGDVVDRMLKAVEAGDIAAVAADLADVLLLRQFACDLADTAAAVWQSDGSKSERAVAALQRLVQQNTASESTRQRCDELVATLTEKKRERQPMTSAVDKANVLQQKARRLAAELEESEKECARWRQKAQALEETFRKQNIRVPKVKTGLDAKDPRKSRKMTLLKDIFNQNMQMRDNLRKRKQTVKRISSRRKAISRRMAA